MKKLTLAALALLAAGAAMADGPSRAQVIAELQRARDSGELILQNSENPDAFGRAAVVAPVQARPQALLPNGSGKTRAEVVAELQRARANGELDAVNGYGGYSHLAAINPPAGRAAPVLAGEPKSGQ